MSQKSAQPRPRRVAGQTIRIDAKTAETPEEDDVRGQRKLMELFRALIGARDHDRRVMPRHEAAAFAIWLGWWRGAQEFAAVGARLGNISRGGALVTMFDPPPQRHTVWICHGSPEPTECVEVRVLEVTTIRRNLCALRLTFAEPCPPGFFEAAVCGLASEVQENIPPRRLIVRQK